MCNCQCIAIACSQCTSLAAVWYAALDLSNGRALHSRTGHWLCSFSFPVLSRESRIAPRSASDPCDNCTLHMHALVSSFFFLVFAGHSLVCCHILDSASFVYECVTCHFRPILHIASSPYMCGSCILPLAVLCMRPEALCGVQLGITLPAATLDIFQCTLLA